MANKLNDYEVLNIMGTGQNGTCFKVKNRSSGENYVWKAIDYGMLTEDKKQLIVTEINLLRDLNHPNIVKYFDHIINKETKTLYIIMECCEGGDLQKLIQKCKETKSHFSEGFIWRVLYQLSKALQGCHSHKSKKITVLHRDIKPANVFLDTNGNIKLGDFGLARVLNENEQFAETVVGTPYYMSPEIIKGSKYNRKSDIWSLGCLTYELCALTPPFTARRFEQLSKNISDGKFSRIPEMYSSDLQKIISFMLSVDHGYRPTIEIILHHPTVVSNLEQSSSTNNHLISDDLVFNPHPDLTSTIQQKEDLFPIESTPALRNEIFGSVKRRIFGNNSDSELYENFFREEFKIIKAASETIFSRKDDPNEITQEIFHHALRQRLEAIRLRETNLKKLEEELKQKDEQLKDKEEKLNRREINVKKIERNIKEKMNRADVYLKQSRKLPVTNNNNNNNFKRPTNYDDSNLTLVPNDSVVIPTVAKFNPLLVKRPKNFERKVSFKSPMKIKNYNIENIPPQKELEIAVQSTLGTNTLKSEKSQKRKSIFSIFQSTTKTTNENLNLQNRKTVSEPEIQLKDRNFNSTNTVLSDSAVPSKWNQENKKAAFDMLALMNAAHGNNFEETLQDFVINDEKLVRHDRKRKSMILIKRN